MSKHCTDEILLSSDKTNAVVDGSGVLSDLAGINRAEVVRLVKLRKLVKNFDKSKLSKDGYLVCVDDRDVKEEYCTSTSRTMNSASFSAHQASGRKNL